MAFCIRDNHEMRRARAPAQLDAITTLGITKLLLSYIWGSRKWAAPRTSLIGRPARGYSVSPPTHLTCGRWGHVFTTTVAPIQGPVKKKWLSYVTVFYCSWGRIWYQNAQHSNRWRKRQLWNRYFPSARINQETETREIGPTFPWGLQQLATRPQHIETRQETYRPHLVPLPFPHLGICLKVVRL